MPKPKIDRRPQVYCANCFRFGGVYTDSRFCGLCGKPLNNRQINVRDLCEANLRAYNEKLFIWACVIVLDLVIAALGYGFKELQNYNVVDIAYFGMLVSVLVITQWAIRKYVHPKYPSVFRNIFFRPGIPEPTPSARMGAMGTDD